MIDEERGITLIAEDGTEVEMTILFTFYSEDYQKEYVLFYDENNPEEVIAASFDEDNVYEVEDEAEWQMCNEMLEKYEATEFEFEEEDQDEEAEA